MKSSRSGQALLESIVAASVLVVGFLSIVGLLSRSIGVYRVTTDQYNASFLASEGVEIVKNLIDAGIIRGQPWGTVVPPGAYELDYTSDLSLNPVVEYAGRYLLFDPELQKYSYVFGDTTTFRRRIVVEAVGADEVKVNSIVDWVSRGGATFSMNVEDHFFNWRD